MDNATQNPGAAQNQPVEGKKVRPNLSRNEFAAIAMTCTSLAELAEKTGYSEATCSQRRSELRKKGYPLPKFTVGRVGETVSDITEEDLKFLAERTGKSVDELKAASATTKEEVKVASARIQAGRAAHAGDKAASVNQNQTA